ncbi:FG-GAP repeat protein [Streptomyces sp. H51]|uniref:FG-GAP repeat protein n=1 Tax=Streptomyces sp. H51 TaxID=3111770 RepID=UPI002D78168B|nr:FG-GAP repeat protein [Streptomyces sp. H51]
MARTRSAAVAAASFLLMAGAGLMHAPSVFAAGSTSGAAASDFDGDGYSDVLIGAPSGIAGGVKGAGYVTVQYGSAYGIGTAATTPKGRTAVFSQATAGVPGKAESGDAFGASVVTGDVNGDGYDDAVIGAPGEDTGALRNAGRVTVLYGSARGLRAVGSVSVAPAAPYAEARFGLALATARLAGSAPGEALVAADRRGADVLAYEAGTLRSKSRLDTTGAVQGDAIEPKSLTTGDYDGDGDDDLVVSGRSLEEDGGGRSAVYASGTGGLTYVRDLGGGPATASGDIDNDGYDDFVYGSPDSPDDQGEPLTGGVVGVYFGGEDGVKGVDELGTVAQAWAQYSPGVPGTAELGDGFGSAVSVADVDGDGYDDLAVGAPGEDVGGVKDAGAVWILRGSASGVTAGRAMSLTQNSAGVPGTAERADRWGGQVRLVDTNHDGRRELLASAPGENGSEGAVWVFRALASGIVTTGARSYGAGVLGASPTGARFGAAISE